MAIEDVIRSLREVVGYGRPPGPNNLLEAVFDYLQQQGSARNREIAAYLEDAWRSAGGTPLSGEEWSSQAEKQVWSRLKVKPALSTLRDGAECAKSRLVA